MEDGSISDKRVQISSEYMQYELRNVDLKTSPKKVNFCIGEDNFFDMYICL